MAIDMTGMDRKVGGSFVSIKIQNSHPLIQLASALPWAMLMKMVVKDLKETNAKGYWWMGRKLKVRLHLDVYILQQIYNLTDRRMEYQLKDNAAFQIFCGLKIVEHWHAPDHTKIEEFRNRLAPETHRALANSVAKIAVDPGFADPSEVDLDSTVQEANSAYPSDACLLTKLTRKGKKLLDYLRNNLKVREAKDVSLDIKRIMKKEKEYFFLAKNRSLELKCSIFKDLHHVVKKEMKPVVNLCEQLTPSQIKKLPWFIKKAFDQIKGDAWLYLLDVAHFIRTHQIKKEKVLSFHTKEVACIKKGKAGKEKEFGRVFQLGRIGGNFFFALECNTIRMNDKENFIPLIEEHSHLFGEDVLGTIATDKGYWSFRNKRRIEKMGIPIDGLQKPGQTFHSDLKDHLHNRRAGIEPLIGHAKHGGQLGKSRMKSDVATLGAGYGSIFGMNLRQMIRHLQGKMKKAS